jgi:hypothetical protein
MNIDTHFSPYSNDKKRSFDEISPRYHIWCDYCRMDNHPTEHCTQICTNIKCVGKNIHKPKNCSESRINTAFLSTKSALYFSRPKFKDCCISLIVDDKIFCSNKDDPNNNQKPNDNQKQKNYIKSLETEIELISKSYKMIREQVEDQQDVIDELDKQLDKELQNKCNEEEIIEEQKKRIKSLESKIQLISQNYSFNHDQVNEQKVSIDELENKLKLKNKIIDELESKLSIEQQLNKQTISIITDVKNAVSKLV